LHAGSIRAWLLGPAVKPVVFVAALSPLAYLVAGAVWGNLGANPAETLIRSTGDWTLRMLCLTLAITPLRQASGWHALARLRRMLGLFSFFYGLVHFLCFAWLDMGLDLAAIVQDVVKRPFILVGTSALLLMLPLAATSFNRAMRWLGAARWQRLHRAVYAVALLALLHFQHRRECEPRVRPGGHHRLGCPCHHHAAAGVAAFGPQVDDPVGFGDDVQVVFDHDHAVAAVHQPVQHADQLLHVGHVQAHGGLVQHVQRVRRFWPRRVTSSRTLLSSVTSLMRCASPPLSVGEGWPSVR
jgi:sulfoxide reductase heme-binding subunit YedZ